MYQEKNTMKTETKHEQSDETGAEVKGFRHHAVERIREGAGTADRMVHQNAYNVLAGGIIVGFIAGFLVSRGCRCCAS